MSAHLDGSPTIVTPEGLVRLLSEQGGAIGGISAEAGLFGILAGRYSPNGPPNLEAVLQATAGDAIRVDRKGSEPVNIPDPALSLGLALQPDLLPDLSKGFHGAGLLARFLWVMPKPRVDTRTIDEYPVPAETATLWKSTSWASRRPRTGTGMPRHCLSSASTCGSLVALSGPGH